MDIGIRDILLQTDAKDLPSICSSSKRYDQICQDPSFWEQYFSYKNRKPPARRPSIMKYYLDNYFYLNTASKYIDYLIYNKYFYALNPPETMGFVILNLDDIDPNLLGNIGLQSTHIRKRNEFLQIIHKYSKVAREEGIPLHIEIQPTNQKNNFIIKLLSDLPFDDGNMDYNIPVSKNQLQIILARLLFLNIPFFNRENFTEIELPV